MLLFFAKVFCGRAATVVSSWEDEIDVVMFAVTQVTHAKPVKMGHKSRG